MNKKGAELPLTTMIVAIIVIVVLVVIIAFFLSGTYSLKQAISRIFYGTTAGSDRGLAITMCQQYCDTAINYPNPESRKSSPYCTQYFSIDTNNDGEADFKESGGKKYYTKWYCSEDSARNAKRDQNFLGDITNLGIPCGFSCDSGQLT
ncbi:MAG: hypothetical protein V1815_01635 [Candidatus Woesearchaeota archaeon]